MISPAARLAVGLGYSLETFFADSPVPRRDRIQLSGLRGEVLSFQVVHRSDRQGELGLDISGPLAASAAARRIDLAHVEHPTYRERPENRIGRAPDSIPTRSFQMSLGEPIRARRAAFGLRCAFPGRRRRGAAG